MTFTYPLNVDELFEHAKMRGPDFLVYLGLEEAMRSDLKLTHLAWGISAGSFPVTHDGTWHGSLDIGLPIDAKDSIAGIKVLAIADGEVVYIDDMVSSEEGFALGRIIIRHQTPAGEEFYTQYKHIEEVSVAWGQQVSAGQELGVLGWHGDFPHLSLAIASLYRIGGDEDLVPEFPKTALPVGAAAFNVLRVKVESFNATDWPVDTLKFEAGYLFSPIEMIRYCRGEPYLHDIGPGSRHSVIPSMAGQGQSIAPGAFIEIRVDLLRSKELSDNGALVELAHSQGFTPIRKGHGDFEAVKAIQRALQSCHFDIGRFGSANDGIDGIFDATLERVVTSFQEGLLRTTFAADTAKQMLAQLGMSATKLRTDGQIDWLTLIGLDLCACAHESAPPPPSPQPTNTPPPPPPPPPPAMAPAAEDWVFDGAAKRYSLQMGMRMYKELLKWEEAKVGYSTCEDKHYGPIIPSKLSPEWPFLGVEGDDHRTVEGSSYPVYKRWGLNWIGSNFSNCCNSQIAALASALGHKTFGVKRPDGSIVTYDIRSDQLKTLTRLSASGPIFQKRTLVIFEQTFVNGTKFYDKDGHPLFATPTTYGAMMCATRFLGIGDALFTFSTAPSDLAQMRIGDLGSYTGHAWLVGDVRYGVWLNPSGVHPTYIIDQSSLVDSKFGTLVKFTSYTHLNSIDGRSALRKQLNQLPLTATDCDWIIENESEFEGRVSALLQSQQITAPDGSVHSVHKIEVLRWRVFSANGTSKTAHSKQYDPDGAENGIPKFKLNATETEKRKSINGVTRPWETGIKKLCVGRFYRRT